MGDVFSELHFSNLRAVIRDVERIFNTNKTHAIRTAFEKNCTADFITLGSVLCRATLFKIFCCIPPERAL